MPLFDWLKPKPPATYTPVNRLEEMLKAAAVDPLARPKFLNQLFHFDLFVLGSVQRLPDGETGSVQMARTDWQGTPAVLAFTSVEALRWFITKANQGEQNYVGMKAAVLFKAIEAGTGVLLNAGHSHGTFFPPGQVKELLTGLDLESKSHTIPAGEKMLIGQPAKEPKALLDVVGRFARACPHLVGVHFALKASGQPPTQSFLVAMNFKEGVGEDKQKTVLEELMLAVKDLPGLELPIDFALGWTPEQCAQWGMRKIN